MVYSSGRTSEGKIMAEVLNCGTLWNLLREPETLSLKQQVPALHAHSSNLRGKKKLMPVLQPQGAT